MKKHTFNIISLIIFLAAIAMLTVIALPLIKSYQDIDKFKAFIDSFGPWGFLMLIFIQIFQIVVAFIPGEVVETLSGMIYGWFGGFAICAIGIAVGQALVFKAVRFFGHDFVEKAAGSNAMNRFKFLRDEKKLKTIIFFLFFIPGTPKDLITYIAPLTKINLRDFLIITLIARTPTIISSTYGGSALAEQDFWKAAIVYGIIAVFSISGIIIHKIWDKKHSSKEKKNMNDESNS